MTDATEPATVMKNTSGMPEQVLSRAATPAERAEDYAKRRAALERAEAEGLYSERQLAQLWEDLDSFPGYRRFVFPEREKPKPAPAFATTFDQKPGEYLTVDGKLFPWYIHEGGCRIEYLGPEDVSVLWVPILIDTTVPRPGRPDAPLITITQGESP